MRLCCALWTIFTNNLTTRLTNPAKNELDRISKVILDQRNAKLRKQLYLNRH